MFTHTPTLLCFFTAVLLPECLSSSKLQSLDRRQIYQPDPDYLDEARPEPRNKRLMGIFRCNGWGPGCTQLDGWGRSGVGGGSRRGGGVRQYRGGELEPNRSPISEKFQPFFTLTSGGSWGPTGKRSEQRPDVWPVSATHRRRPHNIADDITTVNVHRYDVSKVTKREPNQAVSRKTLLLAAIGRLVDEIRSR